jgi:putative FmdB family regulatory protein
MPLYDFRCGVCGERFEARAGFEERPACPSCGAPECERLLSPFSGPFPVGLRGYAARRSNDTRRVREEQRRERREQRRGETK